MTAPGIPRSLQTYLDEKEDQLAVEAWGQVVDIPEIIRLQSINTVAGYFSGQYWKVMMPDIKKDALPADFQPSSAQVALQAAAHLATRALSQLPAAYFVEHSPRDILREYTHDPDEETDLPSDHLDSLDERSFEYWRHIHQSNPQWRVDGQNLGWPFFEASLKHISYLQDATTAPESLQKEIALGVHGTRADVCKQAIRQVLIPHISFRDLYERDRLLDLVHHIIEAQGFELREIIHGEMKHKED